MSCPHPCSRSRQARSVTRARVPDNAVKSAQLCPCAVASKYSHGHGQVQAHLAHLVQEQPLVFRLPFLAPANFVRILAIPELACFLGQMLCCHTLFVSLKAAYAIRLGRASIQCRGKGGVLISVKGQANLPNKHGRDMSRLVQNNSDARNLPSSSGAPCLTRVQHMRLVSASQWKSELCTRHATRKRASNTHAVTNLEKQKKFRTTAHMFALRCWTTPARARRRHQHHRQHTRALPTHIARAIAALHRSPLCPQSLHADCPRLHLAP